MLVVHFECGLLDVGIISGNNKVNFGHFASFLGWSHFFHFSMSGSIVRLNFDI